jgi:hypothetical protein
MMLFPRLAAILLVPTLYAATPAAAADGCDALSARMIRATGASLAGRDGTRAVFRSSDAERMSLDCRARRMVFSALEREPARRYYALIGLAAGALTGAKPETIETLALRLHQSALGTGRPQEGIAGRAALRCETAPDTDPFASPRTRCVLIPSIRAALRRRAGLPVGTRAG